MKNYILILFFLIPSLSFSQEVLTLEQAIEIGLKNNFSIQMAKNGAAVAANNATIGNAGMLPQVNLNATQNNSIVDTKQKFATGQEQNRNGAKSSALNAGVALNWTLFDGLGMFVSYERLKQLKDLGEVQAKITIENAVEEIIKTYYSVVIQKQMLGVIKQNMEISQERMKISETKFTIGSDSKLAYMQAKVDYNADRSAFMKQTTAIENSKIALNNLLSRDVHVKFDVKDTIIISYKPSIEELSKNTMQNTSLQQAEKSTTISALDVKSFRTQMSPRIGMIANYNFAKSQSEAGFQLSNQSFGPTLGFTASMNLFNGFNLNRNYKNAQLSLMNSKLNYNMVKNEIDASITSAFNDFTNKMAVLELENENIVVAKENINAVMERYRLGNISAFDVKEAQRSFTESTNRLVSALYDAKVAETTLMKLSGSLVK